MDLSRNRASLIGAVTDLHRLERAVTELQIKVSRLDSSLALFQQINWTAQTLPVRDITLL